MLKEAPHTHVEEKSPIQPIDQLAFQTGIRIRENAYSNEQPEYGGITTVNTETLIVRCLEDMSFQADHNFSYDNGKARIMVVVDSSNVFARGFKPNRQIITYSVEHNGEELSSEPPVDESFFRKGFTSIKEHLDSLNHTQTHHRTIFEDAAGT